MLKLAKHAVAILVVAAAASAPVAAHAETPSFSFTQLEMTHSIQNQVEQPGQPR